LSKLKRILQCKEKIFVKYDTGHLRQGRISWQLNKALHFLVARGKESDRKGPGTKYTYAQ
jgi:hypothetical protein